MSNTLAVFADLSRSPADVSRLIADWAHPESLGVLAARVTGVVAPGSRIAATSSTVRGWTFRESSSPTSALCEALAAAGRDAIPLLVVLGAVDIGCEAVNVLRQCLERDPMFGFAVPRVSCEDGCSLIRPSRNGVGTSGWVSRRILANLAESELVAQFIAPCLLIRADILGNFSLANADFESVASALLHYQAGARRCGFRTIVSNRAVVRVPGSSCDEPAALPSCAPTRRDDTLLARLVPDLERSWAEFRGASWERFETLYTTSSGGGHRAARPSLLLDLRNVVATHNGTTHAVLATADAFKRVAANWEVELLASPEGAAFHRIEQKYAGWPVHTAPPERSFTLALRPSQPWHIREMVDLHRLALFNAYLVLDTISWDIVYAAPSRLEGTWRFLADHADALLFDSDFTRQRFLARFPTSPTTPTLVTHLSLDPSEYVRPGAPRSSPGPGHEFILVIGNGLDHKDVHQTCETLATAFPFRHITALGPAPLVSPFVTALHSGRLPEPEMHRLYAGAQCVVVPSFYEGFGFPVVTALAYGRTVFARRSALIDELAPWCVPRGKLILFDGRDELVDLVGRFIHGDEMPECRLGARLKDGAPHSWIDVARDALAFLEPIAKEPAYNRWLAREHVVQQLLSYRT